MRAAYINQEEIIDGLSRQTSEVKTLVSGMPTITQIGRSTIDNCKTYGLAMPDELRARHEAVDELASSATLQEGLRTHLSEIAQAETQAYSFLEEGADYDRSYQAVKQFAKGLKGMSDEAAAELLPDSSELLKKLVGDSAVFSSTELASLLRGPIYHTFRGLRSKESRALLEPRLRFRPGFSGRLALVMAGAIVAERTFQIPKEVSVPIVTGEGMIGLYGFLLTAPLAPNEGRMKDTYWSRPTVYSHLRRRADSSEELAVAVHSVGMLDMLSAVAETKKTIETNGHPTVFPEIVEEDVYEFDADDLRNPLLCLRGGRLVVGNSVSLGGKDNRLTFLTGPNSGGKSTLAKTVVQNQVLAHMGAPVVARQARLTLADKITYHVPMPPDLNDETGRFGFELKRVRQILDEASPRSLSVLDDCLDGTTHQERVVVLRSVLKGFKHLSGATLFSTHAHELVEEFEQKGDGQFLQVEFADDRPTYRIQPGVSHTSHANRVAEIYGFSDDEIELEIAQRQQPTI